MVTSRAFRCGTMPLTASANDEQVVQPACVCRRRCRSGTPSRPGPTEAPGAAAPARRPASCAPSRGRAAARGQLPTPRDSRPRDCSSCSTYRRNPAIAGFRHSLRCLRPRPSAWTCRSRRCALRPELVPSVEVEDVLATVEEPAVLAFENNASVDIEALARSRSAVVVHCDDVALVVCEHVLQLGTEGSVSPLPVSAELGEDRVAPDGIACEGVLQPLSALLPRDG